MVSQRALATEQMRFEILLLHIPPCIGFTVNATITLKLWIVLPLFWPEKRSGVNDDP